jgi:hypothetical protein
MRCVYSSFAASSTDVPGCTDAMSVNHQRFRAA